MFLKLANWADKADWDDRAGRADWADWAIDFDDGI